MRRYIIVRLAVAILGTPLCAIISLVSLIIWDLSPALEASPEETQAYGFALLASLVIWLGTLMTFRFPRTAVSMIGIGSIVFSSIAVSYNSGTQGFVPFMLLLVAGAGYGIRERRKDLESATVKAEEASKRRIEAPSQ